MLGLRVRGRGGWDRTCPVAAPISAFLWGSTPFLCARAKKWGGTGRASAVYCQIKRRTRNRARQGGLVIVLCTCAPFPWAVVVAPCCLSTPFLWCLPKETVSSRQRKAPFLPRRLHHPRERYCFVVGTFLARLGAGLVRVGGGWVRTRRGAKRPPKCFGGLLLTFGLDHTSSMTAISAASPRRGPVRVTRV